MTAPPPPAPTIAYNIGVRAGFKLADPDDPKKMDQGHLDTLYAEARFHGDLNETFGWVANFNAAIADSYGSLAPSPALGPMDMILKYHACSAFNVWAGRLLVPSDRSNFTGPFFMSPWNYPGVYAGAGFVGPKTGPNGRDQGGTVWGMLLEDKLKYYVGAYGMDLVEPGGPGVERVYYSGRVSYSFQGTEPGYFGSSTYYGDKSVVTAGLSAQYQKGASVNLGAMPPTQKDTATLMADVLAEEVLEGTGTVSLEAQGYIFNPGSSGPASGEVIGGAAAAPVFGPKEAFYLLAAYLTPDKIGLGKIQPLIRWQHTIDPSWNVVDVQLGYIIKSYFNKIIVNYQHTEANGLTVNQLQFGAQMQL